MARPAAGSGHGTRPHPHPASGSRQPRATQRRPQRASIDVLVSLAQIRISPPWPAVLEPVLPAPPIDYDSTAPLMTQRLAGSFGPGRSPSWALAVFTVLAVLHTWPLATDLAHLSRVDNADYSLNAWA